MPSVLDQISATVRQQGARIEQLTNSLSSVITALNEQAARPRSTQEVLDAIKGRRIESTFSGEVDFVEADEGQQGTPVIINISQDGPFIMTHYPMILWRPTAPSNTPNLGRWRPVTSYPLPTQQVTTDFIDISYQIQDGGNQRNFQNAPRGPLLSNPDNIVPCPLPTMFSPNATIVITPTYNAITFSASPAPTAGRLHVDLIGYRIVNL